MIPARSPRLVLLGVAALALAGSSAPSPRFIAEDAVFPVIGDLPGVVLQPQAGAGGLAFPTSLSNSGGSGGAGGAGDDRLFITLRDGRIVIFANGAIVAQPFLDIRSLVDTNGEGGLLSMAFHPHFAENGFFFVNYTDQASFDTIVARYEVSAGNPNQADPGSARVLLRIDQPFSNHNGGQIQFGPDGYLYVGMGDGGSGNDPGCRAQRDDTLLGKMLRIDVDQNVGSSPFYGIPADNPFRGNDGVLDAIWAKGYRNPWRFSFDRGSGDLYVGDVGQSAREEIDRQPAGSPGGENYGWKMMEGTLCASSASCPAGTPSCNSSALTLPILEYVNGGAECSVIGGYVYRGSRLPQLRGTYLFGDLCSGRIWGASPTGGGGWQVRRLAGAEVVLQGKSLIAFGEDRHGELYVVTSSELFRIDGPAQAGDGDNTGLFDPETVTFSIKTSHTSGPADLAFRFGLPGKGWIPVAGDWDGDGHDTIGYWDAQTKSFRLRSSLTARLRRSAFLPAPGAGQLGSRRRRLERRRPRRRRILRPGHRDLPRPEQPLQRSLGEAFRGPAGEIRSHSPGGRLGRRRPRLGRGLRPLDEHFPSPQRADHRQGRGRARLPGRSRRSAYHGGLGRRRRLHARLLSGRTVRVCTHEPDWDRDRDGLPVRTAGQRVGAVGGGLVGPHPQPLSRPHTRTPGRGERARSTLAAICGAPTKKPRMELSADLATSPSPGGPGVRPGEGAGG